MRRILSAFWGGSVVVTTEDDFGERPERPSTVYASVSNGDLRVRRSGYGYEHQKRLVWRPQASVFRFENGANCWRSPGLLRA